MNIDIANTHSALFPLYLIALVLVNFILAGGV